MSSSTVRPGSVSSSASAQASSSGPGSAHTGDASAAPTYLLPAIPSSAIPIPPPSHSPHRYPSSSNTSQPHASPAQPSIPSFPPNSSAATSNASTSSGKKGVGMSLSTNVSDLLLSSLLPPNLPKLPSSSNIPGGAGGGRKGAEVGAPRELSTQREGLSLPLVSNNFRRFVTRVGPVFWLQDRIEEILFWRKPIWTWAWMMTWTFICFQPRALLLLPSLVLILILLHIHERTAPLPSLLGITIPPVSATDRMRMNPPDSPDPNAATNNNTATSSTSMTATKSSASGYTSTNTEDADGKTVSVPSVPIKEAESGVDYYMNLQAIQNLMGLISDAYDLVAPRLAALQNPSQLSSPLSLPLTPTHLILFLLPPTLLLPLTPVHFIPYLILPLGIAPPLLFHPNITPFLLHLPSHPLVRKFRSALEGFLLTDRLSDEIGRKRLGKVEVWENERLDPKLASASSLLSSSSSQAGPPTIPPGGWASKFLRPSDRSPWVKVASGDTKWKSTADGLPSSSSSSSASNTTNATTSATAGAGMRSGSGAGAGGSNANGDEKDSKMVLALKPGWEWIPGEDWRVDGCGLWSEVGVDEEGWIYSDDSWQNPAATPYTEADNASGTHKRGGSSVIGATASGLSGQASMPGLALRRVTRRRRWCRRVYEVEDQ